MNDNRKIEGIKGVEVFAGIDVGKEAHYLRRLTIVREKIVQETIRCQARLKAVLNEYLPEYEKCFCKLTVKTSLELLKMFGLAGLRGEATGKEVAKTAV
ncbi:MAG: hypothetical protein V2A53_02565 [bacterium]